MTMRWGWGGMGWVWKRKEIRDDGGGKTVEKGEKIEVTRILSVFGKLHFIFVSSGGRDVVMVAIVIVLLKYSLCYSLNSDAWKY